MKRLFSPLQKSWALLPSCSVAALAFVCYAPWELPEKTPTTLRSTSFVNPETSENGAPCLGFDLFRTPPFSSEEELDSGDLVQAYTSPDLLLVQSSKNKSSFGRKTVKSDADWTEGSEIEDTEISPKPTGELLSLKILLEIWLRAVALNQGHHTQQSELEICSRKG